MSNVKQFTAVISQLKLDKMYEGDFFLTWEKSFDEIKGVFAVADALRQLRQLRRLQQLQQRVLQRQILSQQTIRRRLKSPLRRPKR